MTDWRPGMPRNKDQMFHYMDGYNAAIENCARLAQELIVLRFKDQEGADAAYGIITRASHIDALKEIKENG